MALYQGARPHYPGPPQRIGGQYGVPDQYAAAQALLDAHRTPTPGSSHGGVGVGVSFSQPHAPLRLITGTGGGPTATGGPFPVPPPGGPPGPPVQPPPWWNPAWGTFPGGTMPPDRFPRLRDLILSILGGQP